MFRRTTIGIEAIVAHVPRHFIDLGTLAKANNVDPAKYYKGLGCRRMAVAAPNEDPVTMAFEAATCLFERYGINPASIGLLVVGTESGIDCAKPIASYLHGMLGLPPACRTFDTQHACYSATAALRMAADWAAVHQDGRKALVVATDIARYSVGSAGEPTQGAGAVAMLVGEEPRCFQLDQHAEAVFTEEVMDFWRPLYRSAAVVNGKTSIESYLKALAFTWNTYKQTSGLRFEEFDFLLFHVPFPRMAWKAFHLLWQLERPGSEEDEARCQEDFERRAEPALWANQELGNSYSGSLYLSLAGLLERGEQRVAGARVGMFSYGSGCCAEFYSGRIGSSAEFWRDRVGITPGILRRRELNYDRYLLFRQAAELIAREGSYTENFELTDAGQRVSFCGIKDHQRLYARTQRPVMKVVAGSAAAVGR